MRRPTIATLVGFAVLMALAATPLAAEQDGSFVSLFDGKSLDGWKPNENPKTWSIENGAIVCHGPRSHLFYVGDAAPWKDFHFKAQVMRHGDNRLAQGRILGVGGHVPDERAVDLDDVHGKAFQVTERGVAGTEIVDRHFQAKALQGMQLPARLTVLVQKHAFRQFKMKALFELCMALQQVGYLLAELRRTELQ